MPVVSKTLKPCPEPKPTLSEGTLVVLVWASFGPGLRFRFFEILGIARYACGFKNAQALP